MLLKAKTNACHDGSKFDVIITETECDNCGKFKKCLLLDTSGGEYYTPEYCQDCIDMVFKHYNRVDNSDLNNLLSLATKKS